MSVDDVKTFLERTATDRDLLGQVEAAQGADPGTTAANVVALAATIGLTFTVAEYRDEVEDEMTTIFKLHRAVPHHVLLAPS